MIRDYLNRVLIIDGAMGTMIGKTDGIPELLNITEPEKIMDIHRQYVRSGADIITANTFGANRFKLEGTGYTVNEIIGSGVSNAKKCAAESGAMVALDIGSLGKIMTPSGSISFDEAVECFAEQIIAGKEADYIAMETFTDLYELKAAIIAAKEVSTLPVTATVSIDENGRLLCGADLETVVSLLEGLGVDGLGLNCGFGPLQYKKAFEQLIGMTSMPIVILPNAGLPRVEKGEVYYDTTPDEFADYMKYFAENGAAIVGGCCGTTPLHTEKTVKLVKGIGYKKLETIKKTRVSSYTKTVVFDEKPVIIGERINPTGKQKLKEALKNGDTNYIINEAINQKDAGADILDINVGMTGINEADVICETILSVQNVCDLPLQIDSSSPYVLEKAMRIYNGKPLVNSVNGKQEIMDAIFPSAKKYGAVLIALTLDEDGIPNTADGRINIAKKIIKTAEKYGIGKHSLIFDPLAMTISTDAQSAKITLETVRRLHDELGVKTSLGISNISFGLPSRGKINSTFLSLALLNGLSAAIVNPLSSELMHSVDAYNVLMGFDVGCRGYTEKYSDNEETVAVKKDRDLSDIICGGIHTLSYEKTRELLKIYSSLEIINKYIIPALDKTGKDFERGKIFLPGLLASAETAQNAFAAIKEISGKGAENGNKIILATVNGDIHDIGKNIVKMLLENYGYNVIDLGKNVEPSIIVETAISENVKLIGLSALMTTTVPSMEETINALKKTGHKCFVMVGGAVLTDDYAKEIGADFYGADAMSAVRYANSIFN